jgi:hypothetical protein
MQESQNEERIYAAIDQLRGELRDVQRHMLQGAILMCVIVQVSGFFALAAVILSHRH